MDELAIGQTFGADRSVDALDPESPKTPLLHLAVAVGVLACLFDRLAGDADGVLAAAIIALSLFQDPLVFGAGGHTPFDACHRLTSLLQAVGGPALYRRRVGVGKQRSAAVLANIFGVVADQAVALAGHPVLDLAGRRE